MGRFTTGAFALALLWMLSANCAIAWSQPVAARAPQPEIVLQLGHQRPVEALAVSPDGSRVLSRSDDGALKQWDLRSGALWRDLGRGRERTSGLVYSPDGHKMAVATRDLVGGGGQFGHSVQVWDATTGAMLWAAPHVELEMRSLAFSGDGRELIALGWHGGAMHPMRAWDAATGRLRRERGGNGSWGLTVLSRDGQVALSEEHAAQAPVTLRDVGSGRLLHGLPVQGQIVLAAFAANGKTVATGSMTTPRGFWNAAVADLVQLWDVKTGTLKRTLTVYTGGFSRLLEALALSPDGQALATAGQDNTDPRAPPLLKVWDTATGKMKRAWRSPTASGWSSLAFTPDGRRVVAGSNDGAVEAWDVASGRVIRTPVTNSESLLDAGFSPDGKLLVSLSLTDFDPLRLWDVTTGRLRAMSLGHLPGWRAWALDPSSQLLATGGPGWVKVWDVQAGVWRRTWAQKGELVTALAFAPDGKTLAIGSVNPWRGIASQAVPPAGSLRVWHLESPTPVTLAAKIDVEAMTFSPDGTKLGCLHDPGLTVWDVAAGRSKFSIPLDQGRHFAFTPEGKILTLSAAGLHLWDAATGAALKTLADAEAARDIVALLPDGQTIAVPGETEQGDALQLLDVFTGQPKGRLPMSNTWDTQIIFPPTGAPGDYHLMATMDGSNTLRLWQPEQGRLVVTLVLLPSAPNARPEWIAFTPGGHYDASPGAAKFILWRMGDELFPAARFEPQFHRPDLVQKALRGRSAALPPPD